MGVGSNSPREASRGPPEDWGSTTKRSLDNGFEIETNWNKTVEKFDDLGIKEKLLRGIYSYGFENPSAIQQRAILPAAQGRDVIAQAQSGTTAPMPFVAMGSGSLCALSVLEAGYKMDMDEDSAKQLAKDAISAGIFNDLGSGSNVDLCVIKKDSTEYLRTFASENAKGVRQGDYTYKPGTTAVRKREVMKIDLDLVKQEVMETD